MIAGVVMAGGSGKRLWPLSRNLMPKQFLALATKKSLLEDAIIRLGPVVDSVAVSTGKDLESRVAKIVPGLKMIVEPARRDTAAAMGLCATQFSPDDTLVFVASDAYISPAADFQETIRKAIALSEKGMVVVGVKPKTNSTAYGYIEPGPENRVKSFKEKPDALTAREYVEKGFLWNISIFVCKASVMLGLFREHAPDIYKSLMEIREFPSRLAEIYPSIRKTSFDYAVVEKAADVFYVPASFYWNDIGMFSALTEVVKEKNVVLSGDLLELNSSGNVISSPKGKKVALIDCEGMVVIDTSDALLVCPKSSSAKVKTLVEEKVPQGLQ